LKIKKDSNNNPVRYKARLVAKGYEQIKGIDYNETFAPVVKIQSIRLLLAISVNEGLTLQHVDISTAFLYGEIDEEVYIEIPEGIVVKDDKVLKLNKALYGLKQASRLWNQTLVKFLNELNFRQLKTDMCIFINRSLIVAINVDDIITAGKENKEIEEFKLCINEKFKTKDLGKLNFILGIKIEYINSKTLIINQNHYIDKIINKYKHMKDGKPSDIPIQPNHKLTSELNNENETLRHLIDPTKYRQAIGSLIYLMTCSRPDICYSVSILSRFMEKPRELHWRFVKRLLRYVMFTKNYSLVYSKNTPSITGYTDSDYASSIDDRKSISGYLFKYGECSVSWNSSKQKTVALSSTEAEYVALTNAIKEGVWLKQLLSELGSQDKMTILCDNKSTICLTNNPEFHSRTKHIDIRFHYVRETIETYSITIDHITTEKNIADLFTKGLPRIKHHTLIEMIGLKQLSKSVESNNLIKTVNLTLKSKSDSSISLKPHKAKLKVKEDLI
jgi:hypothetical protein